MSNKFISIMEKIGSLFKEGITEIIKYLPPIELLSSLLFPAAVAPEQAALSTAELLQNAIATVEQKYAASGVQSGTGAQKAAEVLTITEGAVTTMLADPTVQKGLAEAGITVDSTYINNLISAVVGFLNVQGVTGTASGVTETASTTPPAPVAAPPSSTGAAAATAGVAGGVPNTVDG